MVIPRFAVCSAAVCASAFLISCGPSSTATRQPSIGIAYVGPATLNLREDLAAKSAAVVEVKHGDRLDIIETRRRLVRVRTVNGVEGWTDSNLLLSAEQMDELRRMAAGAGKYPSQGAAKVFDSLNVHTEPSRSSPSFAKIPEGGSVEVLQHRATPRGVSARPKAAVAARTPPAKATKKDSKKAAALLLPPPPAPPPRDWEQMSHPRASELPEYAAPAAPPLDDWDLVRTPDGRVGWVLARMLYMAIPDEVAQYAEGKRITAYLAIGDVKDGDEIKHNWLWSTASNGLEGCDFDSIRVFVWSLRRHRYETAFIDRNVIGFFPLQLASVPRDKSGVKEQGFSLGAQEKDGALMTRTYAFSGYHVRLVSRAPVAQAKETAVARTETAAVSDAARETTASGTGWWQKAWRRWFAR